MGGGEGRGEERREAASTAAAECCLKETLATVMENFQSILW
jgi:hypothetical protein